MVTDAAPQNPQRTKGVDSARRALQILLEFDESRPELTIDGIVEDHGISVPSAYRYVSLLRELNLVEERSKGTFALSPRIIKIARAAELSLDYRAEAQPILDRLSRETDETALYIRRVNDSAVCLAMAESSNPISISFSPGHLMPLHGGAAAKILLADYPRRAQYLTSIGTSAGARKRFESELDEILDAGYAESSAEVDADVWAAAAGVRVQGALVGAITVVAPAYRLTSQHQSDIMESVRDAARELERILSGA